MKKLLSSSVLAGAAMMAAACQSDAPEGPTALPPLEPSPLEAYERQSHSSALEEYRALGSEQRLALWSEQIDRFLQTPLTAKERDLLLQIKAELPQWLSSSADEVERRMETRVVSELGEDFAREVFGILGDPELRMSYEVSTDPSDAILYSGGACNTRWCTLAFDNIRCGPCDYDSHSDGCGWFNMQPCTHRYELDY